MLATVIQTPVDVVHKCLHKPAAVDDLVQRIVLEKKGANVNHRLSII